MSLLTNSPFRPPHWRCLRINEFLEPASNMRLSRKRDDELIWRAVRFLRKRDRLRTARGKADCRARNSDIADALDLVNDNSPLGIQIHARVLARQTDFEIAYALAMPVGVIHDYVGLRFDVRSKLHAHGYILAHVIEFWKSPKPTIMQLFLLAAYTRGPGCIPAFLDWLAHRGEEHDLTTDVGRTRAAVDFYVQANQMDFAEIDSSKLLRNLDILMQMKAQHHDQHQHSGGFAKYVARNLPKFVQSDQKTFEISSVISSQSDETNSSDDFADRNRATPEQVRSHFQNLLQDPERAVVVGPQQREIAQT